MTEFPIPSPGDPPADRRGPGRQPLVHRIPRPARSGGSRPRARSRSSRSTRRQCPRASPAGPTATSGSPTRANRSARSRRPAPITEFAIPTADAHLLGITAGPDGNLWFAEARTRSAGSRPSGVDHRIPDPDRGRDAGRAHGRSGRQPVVHGGRRQQDRTTRHHVAHGPAGVRRRTCRRRTNSNVNGVLEPGETVEVSPRGRTRSWSAGRRGIVVSRGARGGTYIISDASPTTGHHRRRDGELARRDG